MHCAKASGALKENRKKIIVRTKLCNFGQSLSSNLLHVPQ